MQHWKTFLTEAETTELNRVDALREKARDDYNRVSALLRNRAAQRRLREEERAARRAADKGAR